MDYKIQLISIMFSFLFGFVLSIINRLFNLIIKKRNMAIKLVLSSLFSFIISFFYVYLLYKINEGVIHIYFILMLLLGVVIESKVNVMSKISCLYH